MSLKSVGTKALAWLDRKRSYFDPQTQNLPLDEVHATALTELALFCFLLRRKSGKPLAAVARLVRVVDTLYRRPEFHQAAFFNRHTLIAHLIIRLALTPEVFDEILPPAKLSRLAGQNLPDLSNRSYRSLELAYLLDLNEMLPHPFETELLGPVCLEQTLFNSLESSSNMYAATHTIFYLTDFGRRQAGWLWGRKRAATLARLNGLLQHALSARNWDLAGELMLSKKCLGFAADEMTEAACLRLAKAQEPGGLIGRATDAQLRLNELTAYPTKAKKLFLRLYHPTLVAAMAGLLIDE